MGRSRRGWLGERAGERADYFLGEGTSNNYYYSELIEPDDCFSNRFQSGRIVFGLDGMAEKRRFMDFEDKKKKYKGRKDK